MNIFYPRYYRVTLNYEEFNVTLSRTFSFW